MDTILNSIIRVAENAARQADEGKPGDQVLNLAQACVELTKSWATIQDIEMHKTFHQKEEDFPLPGEGPLVGDGGH